ncbi:MAG: DNA-binding NtrC family response regulator [Myxococcota bacterium]|jgi:DNA-binding NtrC family response regulator
MNVVVLDDSSTIQSLFKRQIASRGNSALDFSRAAQVRYHLENYSADVLVTDMRMPDVDGITLIKQFRKANPAVRIVAISADRGKPLPPQATEAWADVFLIKPCSPDRLKTALEKLQ